MTTHFQKIKKRQKKRRQDTKEGDKKHQHDQHDILVL